MWRRRFLALAALTTALGCAEASENAREAVITNALVGADLAVIRARPGLVAGRYARMATAPYEFYRGSLAVFLRDWRDGAMPLSRSRFALDWPQPLGVGDPHPENFGTLLGADGALRLEVNDLDGADRVPYLWDLRRLTVGLCLAARLANEGDAPARRRSPAPRLRHRARRRDGLRGHPRRDRPRGRAPAGPRRARQRAARGPLSARAPRRRPPRRARGPHAAPRRSPHAATRRA